jgi:cytoskeletal protein CcmA (bactofilin family)
MRTPIRPRSAPTSSTVGRLRRVLLVAGAVGAMLLVSAGPALAQSGGGQDLRDRVSDRRIGVGNVFVAEGESLDTAVVAIDGNAYVDGSTSNGVLVVSGNAYITGSVGDSVLVIDGDARVSGRVDGDVVVLEGRALIEDGAVITGDVSSSKEPRVAQGATVRGEVKDIDATGMFTAFGFTLLGLIWLAVTISTAILGVVLIALFGRPFDTAAATARTSTGKSIGWGVILWIGLPAVAFFASVSLLGLPLGLGTGGALGVLGALGYVTSALFLGRLMIKAPRNIFGAFFAGWGILRLLALLPGIGMLVWAAASVLGVGALAVTAWRASRGKYVPPEAPAGEAVATPPPTDADTGEVTSSDPAAGAATGTETSTTSTTATKTDEAPAVDAAGDDSGSDASKS